MWVYRQNRTLAAWLAARNLTAPDALVHPERWAVCDDDAGIIDSLTWLTEAAALARATALNDAARAQSAASAAALTAAGGDATEGRPFYAVLCVNEYEAADGRYFEAFDWATPPLSLWTLDSQEGGGHMGSEASGSIRTVERMADGRRIFATGFLATTEEGLQTEQQIEQQVLRFVSVDPADYDCEEEITKIGSDGWPIDGRLRFSSYTIGGATVLGNPAIRLAVIWLDGMDAPDELVMPLPEPIPRVEVPEIVDVDEGDIIIIQAGAGMVQPDGDTEPLEQAAILADDRDTRALLASARAEAFGGVCMLTHDCGGPALPPAEFFHDPQLSAPTPLTVTPEGRIFGHVALWNTPHRGFLHYELQERIYAPHNRNGYANFLVHRTPVACCADHATCGHDQERIPTGVLTIATSHAGVRLSPAMALAHYENTGLSAADVTVGEDAHGIWLSGALRPGMDDTRVREVLGASPSGDWRWIGGELDLCAILGVNSGGFPILASAHVEDGEVRALIAGYQRPRRGYDDPEALVASLGQTLRQRKPGVGHASRLPEGVVVVERARLERLEADMALLRPLLADQLQGSTLTLLAEGLMNETQALLVSGPR